MGKECRFRWATLDYVITSPGSTAVGEERAWGRRLAKRFGVDRKYDANSFVAQDGQSGFLDYEADLAASKAKLATLFTGLDAAGGDALVVYGWTMAEDLVKLGARS